MSNQRGFERSDRVSQQIHEVVARLFLREINDPRLEKVEIVDVDLTPDLRNAHIYYLIREVEEPPKDVKKALTGVTGYVQSQLADRMDLRVVPEVQFFFDESTIRGQRMDALLSNLDNDKS